MVRAEPNTRPGLRDALAVKPVKTAYQQVADQLRTLILGGDLAPGDRLPPESELIELFGVSRSTVREALRALSSQGLITTSRGATGGSVVAPPDESGVGEYLEVKIGLLTRGNHLGVDELLEARALLEVPAAGLAALRRRDAELTALERDTGRRGQPIPRENHMRFHESVLDASGNSLLRMMTRPLFGVLRVRFLRDAAPTDFWNAVGDDHHEILDAIRKSDQERAEQRMSEHLSRLRDTYLAIQRRFDNEQG